MTTCVTLLCLSYCFCGLTYDHNDCVLDYIAEARSQEDDVHNVQSVIDSLSLDYLQISLSHITGIINIFSVASIQNFLLDLLGIIYHHQATVFWNA